MTKQSQSWQIERPRLPSRQQLTASLFSIAVLVAALTTLWLGHLMPDIQPETIEIREIALSIPPPPPPPPPMTQQPVVETPLTLAVQGAGPTIQMANIKQQIKISKPEVPAVNIHQTQWQSLEIDWDAFKLNDLDGMPTLLTPLQVAFPKSLSRQGINRVLIKLDVVINEQGQVTLVDIVENPHPELISEIQRLVKNSRFTAPQKDNQPVRARFIWPVEIES